MIVVDHRHTRDPTSAWKPFVPKRPRSWGFEAAMVCALVVLTIPLAWTSPLVEFDIWIRDLSDAHRPDWAEQIVIYTNMLGQGGALGSIALVLAALIAWRRHTVRPLIAFLAAYSMAGSVLLLKFGLLRVYPHWPTVTSPPYATAEQATIFTTLEPAGAYPSGHVLNTIVWYGFIVLLVGAHFKPWQRRLFLIVPPIVVTLSTTYLGFHWFTDTPAGLFVGLLIIRIVKRVRWETVELPSWLEPEKRYL